MKFPSIHTNPFRSIAQILFSAMLIFFFMLPETTMAQRTKSAYSLEQLCEPIERIEFLKMKATSNISREDFLLHVNELLKLPIESEFEFVSARSDENGFVHSKYQQHYHHIPVMGGEMIINEKNGRVVYVNGSYMSMIASATVPKITAEQALNISMQQIESKDYLWLNPIAEQNLRTLKEDNTASYKPIAALIWMSNFVSTKEKGTFSLCWKYDIHVAAHLQSASIYVDAMTGEVRQKIPLQHSCSQTTVNTLWNGPKSIYTKQVGGIYTSQNDCATANIRVYNANAYQSTASLFADNDNVWPNTLLNQYMSQTMYSVEQARSYYSSIHNRNSFDSAGQHINVYLNPGYNNNAYWDGGGSFLTFGGNPNGDSAVVSLDIAGHEFTHGVVQYSSQLAYSYESGALNESFADIFGENIEQYAIGSANWLVGNETSLGTLRNFSNPHAEYHPDTYQGTNWISSNFDNGGVHFNSSVQNYWYYLLVNGGSGTNDNGYPYSLSGIGITKARTIAYQTMIGLFSSAQFADSKDLSIQVATNLYGQCSAEVAQVRKAWAAVGVGPAFMPYITNNSVTASATSTLVCEGSAVTITGGGATNYFFLPGYVAGSVLQVHPTVNTTYTVVGTNAAGGCGGTSSITINVKPIPNTVASVVDSQLCAGQSTSLSSSVINDTLQAPMDGISSTDAICFNLHSTTNLSLKAFKIRLSNADSVQVWYKPGGFDSLITTNVGWTKLGNAIPVNAPGSNNYLVAQLPTVLQLTGGQTMGIMLTSDGYMNWSGTNSMSDVFASNSALSVSAGGVGGVSSSGVVYINYFPCAINGQIIYSINANSISWQPSTGLSSATIANPVATPPTSTNYTVTTTASNGCTLTNTAMVYVTTKPSFYGMGTTPSVICKGSTALMDPLVSSSQLNQLASPLNGNQANGGNVFNISAIKPISIYSLYAELTSGSQAEVWYKAGGYGGANLTSSTGWTKLGSTVFISPAGLGQFTLIPITAALTIPAGQTYGIAIVTGGVMRNKTASAIDGVVASNLDVIIKAGHSGTGMSGNFNFTSSPRAWCGKISYVVDYGISSFNWSPATGLSSTTIATPTVNVTSSTNYTLSVTDANGCTASSTVRAYVRSHPQPWITASPAAICAGGSSQLNVSTQTEDADLLATPLTGTQFTNTNGGVMFDINTTKAISISSIKTRLSFGASQAEVWYKSGGYGNANSTSSAGWTKIGNTINVTSSGPSNLTTITLSTPLNIPSNSTYGLAIVCNSVIYFSSGTSIGTVINSGPDLSIKEGHSGTGFGGTFNFNNSPAKFNGEIHYTMQAPLNTFAWTNSVAISNSAIANPVATPTSNSSYSVAVTDANGCSSVGYIGVQVMNPSLGNAVASPATVCLGNSATLSYTAPLGSQCNGGLINGFSGDYAPATWTTLAGGLGSINTIAAPNSITITSGNTGTNTSNVTSWQHTISCSGYVTFNWNYSTTDAGPSTDYPRYAINTATPQVFSGFNANYWYSKTQSGTFSMYLNAGDVLQLQAYTSNNSAGACSIIISNFQAPVTTPTTQSIAWYNTASGGTPLGLGNTFSFPANFIGSNNYFAEITNTANGCTSLNRLATNAITGLTLPALSVNGNGSICTGESVALIASGANSYQWTPGNIAGNIANVSPANATTYTVTGTHSNGCTATATKVVAVNALPVVVASASTPTINCSGSSTLTSSGASTYLWMPMLASGNSVSVTPTTSTTYTVTGTSSNGCTASSTVSINFIPCSNGIVNLNLLIEGYYAGNGQMIEALYNQGATINSSMTDSIIVNFHSPLPPFPVVHTSKVTLKNNGASDCEYPGSMIGLAYYISIQQRNSVETWTVAPVLLSSISYYDFTADASQAYGSNQVEVEPGVFAFYSGDINQDENIDLLDLANAEIDINNFAFGYYATDINGDGNVDLLDLPIVEENVKNFIFSVHP